GLLAGEHGQIGAVGLLEIAVGQGVAALEPAAATAVHLQLLALDLRLTPARLGLIDFLLAVFGQLQQILPRLVQDRLGMVAIGLIIDIFQLRQNPVLLHAPSFLQRYAGIIGVFLNA